MYRLMPVTGCENARPSIPTVSGTPGRVGPDWRLESPRRRSVGAAMESHSRGVNRAASGPGRRASVLAGGVFAVGQAAARGGVAIYSLVLIHQLSSAQYGNFAYALGLFGILLVVADGGFSRLLVRDVARSDRPAPLISSLLTVRALCVLMIVVLCIPVGVLGLLPFDSAAFAILLAALMFESLAIGFESAAIGAELPSRVAIGQILASVALLSWLVVILGPGRTLAAAFAGLAIAAAVKLVWHVVAFVGGDEEARLGTHFANFSGRLQQAWPYLALSILGIVYYRIDVVLLHALKGATATAPYAAAYRVVDAALVAGGVVAAVMAPRLSRDHGGAPGAVVARWRRYLLGTLAASAVPVALLAIFAHPIARVLFGQRYEHSAGDALLLLAPGIVFMLLHMVNAAAVLMGNEQRWILVLSAFNVAFNIALTSILVDADGSSGAALATTISEVVTFTSLAVIIPRRFGARVRPATPVATIG
jgi:O-antigen/teichoic acid export membrane protein